MGRIALGVDQRYRADIQGLRAIAVLLVLLFHFGGIVEGGYLGVDMFFVISGFVIAQSTQREISESGSFNWRSFLRRRVRRLLPGAAIVVLFTAVAALVLLSPFGPQQETRRMIVGAATYSTNFLLMPTGYFSIDSASNPLLHFWSLAVEEQFYLLWPVVVLLFLILRKRINSAVFRKCLFFALAASIAVSCSLFYLFTEKSSSIEGFAALDVLKQRGISLVHFGFYSPITRAWEFLVGSLSALVLLKNREAPVFKWPSFIWLVGAISVLFSVVSVGFMGANNNIPESSSHALPALLSVFGTALLLISGSDFQYGRKALEVIFLRKIGDWSYSIYLWHFPLWVFASRLWPPGWVLAALITFASIGIGALQFKLFENPIRLNRVWRNVSSKGLVITLFATSLVVSACYSWLTPQIALRISGRETGELALHAIERQCLGQSIKVGNATSCIYSDVDSARTVILVGDSMAKSLSDGFIEAANNLGFRSLVFSLPGCPFLVDNSTIVSNDSCTSWRTNVFGVVQKVKPDVLVVANLNSLYLELLGQANNSQQHAAVWATDFESMVKSAAMVARSVLIVQPPPKFAKDVTYDISLVSPIGLEENRDEVIARRYEANLLEAEVVGNNNPQVQIYNFSDIFCGKTRCSQVVDGQLMFEDIDHLTPQGSLLLVGQIEEFFKRLTGL